MHLLLKLIRKKKNPILNKNKNLYKPIIAILTKTPLKKIEKVVFTSTCVLVNQKWKGKIGIFMPKPKKIRLDKTKKVWLLKITILLKEFMLLLNKYKITIKKKKEPSWVQNKK